MAKQNEQTPHTESTVKDTSGKPVNVVERDIADQSGDTKGVDEVLTPTSIREKEQDAQTLNEKLSEVERKLAKD